MSIKQVKWVFILITVVVTSLFGIGGYLLYQLGTSVYDTVQDTHREFTLSAKRNEKVDIEQDPFTILLMGTDARSATTQNWRPDVLMLAAINPKTESIKLISIPRDTYVEIANTDGGMDKINASASYAYARGEDSVQAVRETVENLFHIPVDYYAKVNFQGFTDIVNALGGVNVNIPFPFEAKMIGGEWATFEEGPTHLNGQEALAYVRMRKQDPEGDKGRNQRQREVIQDLIDRMTEFQVVTKFSSLTQAVQNNFEYSFSLSEIPTLTQSYRNANHGIEEIELSTTPDRKYLGGVYAYIEILSEEERVRISHLLQKQLDYVPSEKADMMVADQGSIDENPS